MARFRRSFKRKRVSGRFRRRMRSRRGLRRPRLQRFPRPRPEVKRITSEGEGNVVPDNLGLQVLLTDSS